MACAARAVPPEKRVRNEISGQRQQIGSKGLGQLHRPLQVCFSHIRPKMHVADLRDAEAVEGFRQSAKSQVDVLRDQVSRFQEKPVRGSDRGHRGSSNQESTEEFPARQQTLLHIRSLALRFRLQ